MVILCKVKTSIWRREHDTNFFQGELSVIYQNYKTWPHFLFILLNLPNIMCICYVYEIQILSVAFTLSIGLMQMLNLVKQVCRYLVTAPLMSIWTPRPTATHILTPTCTYTPTHTWPPTPIHSYITIHLYIYTHTFILSYTHIPTQ